MKKQYIQTIYFLFIILLIAVPAISQPSLPDPAEAPVDGGLSLLIAGGIGYGVKKIKESRKKK